MSRYTTESEIKKVIDYLDEIDRAHRNHDDEKLEDLAGDADKMVRLLKNAQAEVHRHWEKD